MYISLCIFHERFMYTMYTLCIFLVPCTLTCIFCVYFMYISSYMYISCIFRHTCIFHVYMYFVIHVYFMYISSCMYISSYIHVYFMNSPCIFHVVMNISHVYFITCTFHVYMYFMYSLCIFHVPDIYHHVQVFQLAHLQYCGGVRGQY